MRGHQLLYLSLADVASVGLAMDDMAMALTLCQRAVEKGIGT